MTTNETPRHRKLEAVVERAFERQDTLNQRLNPNWKTAGYPYYRAVWTEAAEALQPLNWTWWKAGQYGKPLTAGQVADLRLELCDILHFGLSLDLVDSLDMPFRIPHRVVQFRESFSEAAREGTYDPAMYLEKLVFHAVHDRTFHLRSFAYACNAVDLSLEKLMVMYFGKSVLNRLRWDNGYNLPKEDPNRYIKRWPSDLNDFASPLVEDNEHLIRLTRSLIRLNSDDALLEGIFSGEIEEGIRAKLKDDYARVARF